jgi:hypothetical protein
MNINVKNKSLPPLMVYSFQNVFPIKTIQIIEK